MKGTTKMSDRDDNPTCATSGSSHKPPPLGNCITTTILNTDSNGTMLWTGIVITFCMWMWVKESYKMYKRTNKDTCNLFQFFVVTSWVRLALPRLCRMMSDEPETAICIGNAAAANFMHILEVELLTHMCIERYVVTKYTKNGWPICKWHYKLYYTLSIFFAFLYSFVPFFGIGQYAKDLIYCDTCSFDVILPDNPLPVTLVWIMKGLKPPIVMIIALKTSLNMLANFDEEKKKISDSRYTVLVIGVAAVNIGLWYPMAFIKGWIVYSQYAYGEVTYPPTFSIRNAPYGYEFSPILTVLAIQAYNYMMFENDKQKLEQKANEKKRGKGKDGKPQTLDKDKRNYLEDKEDLNKDKHGLDKKNLDGEKVYAE